MEPKIDNFKSWPIKIAVREFIHVLDRKQVMDIYRKKFKRIPRKLKKRLFKRSAVRINYKLKWYKQQEI